MGAPDILGRLQALGLTLQAAGGRIVVRPRQALTDEARSLIRSHKAELLAVLGPDKSEGFDFAPPSDSANDAEALAERAAIMAEANGWDDATALQEARWQAHREQCWRAFLRNAARILAAPEPEREGMLSLYREQAASRYGTRNALDMAASLRSWIEARRVH